MDKKGSGSKYLMYIAIGIGLGFVHALLPKEYKPILLAGSVLLDIVLWLLRFEMSNVASDLDNNVIRQPYKRL
ncbi:conserved hypothetical protein [Caldicellulosiruptor hydrothermalis 108]|uniref:Uncharacterized protein n=1 Tax=Caldicellulosiruptor hydrothermalis (strain DSM 18901 / VKM B-2411 / 108) TaxID=632292 RepID=E4Q9R2_CALH1|nr:hypothetical protein [Caldicellulosiruptor hydrothermalis]ADQ08167.1 conserved hypothetical protein [Caldicellulosiruptor hydrothermalis 108]